MRNVARRIFGGGRAVYLAAVAVVFAMAVAGTAGATEPTTYSVAPVTESISAEITAQLPTILGIVGALLALGLVIHMIRKHTKATS